MSDIESIGISLVLENGVAEGLRRLERDLALFDRATEQRAAKMQSLALAHLPRFAEAPTSSANATAAAAPLPPVTAQPVETPATDKHTAWLPPPIPRIQQAPSSRLTPSVPRPAELRPRDVGHGKEPAPASPVPATRFAAKPKPDQPKPVAQAVTSAPSAKVRNPQTSAKAADAKAAKAKIAITTSPRATPPRKSQPDAAIRAAAAPKPVTAVAPPSPPPLTPVADRVPVPPIRPRAPNTPSITVSLSSQPPDRPAPPPSRVSAIDPVLPTPQRPRPAEPALALATPLAQPLLTAPLASTTVTPLAPTPAATSPPPPPIIPPACSRAAPKIPAPRPVDLTPASRDLAPSAASSSTDIMPLQGALSIDGAQIGRWLAETVARQAARPPTSARRFNSRMMPNWPGYTN